MDLEICAWCPRLCRHVCPVAVATGWEAATPTALATAAWRASRGTSEPGPDLCLGCGACDVQCGVNQPASAAFRALRPPVLAAPLSPIVGEAGPVDVLFPDEPETSRYIRTPDAFGHAAWLAGDPDVVPRLVRHLQGCTLRVRHGDVAAILEAAGIPFERAPAPAGAPVFHTCWSGPRPSTGQLACCGRREGFDTRAPEAASLVAEENVRLMASLPHVCDDAACAAWLRRHGARIEGPEDAATDAPPLR